MINSMKKISISVTTALILTTSSVIIPVGNNIITAYASTYTGNSIVDYLNSVGINSSFSNRANLAVQYGIVYSTSQYTGSPDQNTRLLQAMRNSSNNTGTYNGNSIVDYLNSIGVNSSFSNRANLAVQYGIVYSTSQYTGSPDQNTRLLQIMRNGSTQPTPSSAPNQAVANFAEEYIRAYGNKTKYNSDSKRGDIPNYADCSSFAWYCYKMSGRGYIGGTSSRIPVVEWDSGNNIYDYCRNNNFGISKSQLQPGDLVIWINYDSKGNDHVAIYAGNDYIIDCSHSQNGVTKRKLTSVVSKQPTMYAKPI